MQSDLADVLSAAYEAKVLHRGDLAGALKRFTALTLDPDFLAAAKAELKRTKGVPDRKCFATRVTRDFLTEALAFAEKSSKEGTK